MIFEANKSGDRKTISAPSKSNLPSLPHDTRDNAGRGGERDNNESELRKSRMRRRSVQWKKERVKIMWQNLKYSN